MAHITMRRLLAWIRPATKSLPRIFLRQSKHRYTSAKPPAKKGAARMVMTRLTYTPLAPLITH